MRRRYNYRNYDATSPWLQIIFLLFVAIILWYIFDSSYKDKINEKIENLDGVVLTIKEVSIFDKHPFKWVSTKSDHMYKFTYRIGVKYYTGWVRFSFTTEWILGEEENEI